MGSKQYESLTDKQKGYYDGYDVGYLEASKLRPTLREHYAGFAMQGIISNTNHSWTIEEVAIHSLDYADALISELNKEKVSLI